MKILMMTNTFAPHTGGVARSVKLFMDEYLRMGHEVLTVAPAYPDAPEREEHILRVPALVNVHGSDFAMTLAFAGRLASDIEDFGPDVVHSHHPFLIGSTAVRAAGRLGAPLVFTHHTMYEQYVHYVPVDLVAMKGFVARLASGYANLCDAVIAPSESVAETLAGRGVTTPISVIPTGVRREEFCPGDGGRFRAKHGIPADAFVAGHLGRLGPEKNMGLLAEAVALFLARHPAAHCVIAGSGTSMEQLREGLLRRAGERVHMVGPVHGDEVAEAYRAMDVFVFTSLTETQGLVLLEAMGCGIPVVAVNAPGVREVVRDGHNGLLVERSDAGEVAAAMGRLRAMSAAERGRLSAGAVETADRFSMSRSAKQCIELYRRLIEGERRDRNSNAWHRAAEQIKREWELLSNFATAAALAIKND